MPRGLSAGGVTTWALRTAEVLATRGRAVCLIIHREDPGAVRLHPTFAQTANSSITLIDIAHLPPLESCNGNLAPYIPAYRDAMRAMVTRTRRPAVFVPTLLGDSFGIAAALTLADPECIRILGWQHSPIPYDTQVLARYEPILSKLIAVSDQIGSTLRASLAHRATDIRIIPHGIDAPATVPPRPPPAARPLRLIYAGRMENDLKRAMSLLSISDALAQRGIDHRLTLVGDGPAQHQIDAGVGAGTRRDRIRRLAPLPPSDIRNLLAEHDLFILPSRTEGLSLSAVEAMAAGCVPIMTRTPSGADQLVEDARSGLLVDVPPASTNEQLAELFAAAIQRALAIGLPALSAAAHRRALERFSMDAYAISVEHTLEDAARSAPRSWPTDRPCAFTASGPTAAGSGAVPADGPARLRELLARLAGRSVILHGTGRHTIELAPVLADSPARIVAFTDDDPKRHGATLWNWPIIAPHSAARTGATDVIISSWMNQPDIWDCRETYEKQGLKVHRIYEP